jgi:hypothetical protein
MAWQGALRDLELDDEEKWDLGKDLPEGSEPPDYPSGLTLTLSEGDLERVGCCEGEPGDTTRFAAMGEVTAVHQSEDDARVELQIGEFAGEDGKFIELEHPAYICLTHRELGKMSLDCDCEVGDLIHLIGEAKLVSISRMKGFAMDEDDEPDPINMATLQVTHLGFEDESSESREA